MVKRRIAVIDDDAEFLSELGHVILSHGYDPILFSNSLTAFKAIRDIKPDMVIVDLKMPAVNGFQLANELRRSYETSVIPIIAVTGIYTRKEDLQLMHACGIRACLVKPIELRELLAVIDAFLKPGKQAATDPQHKAGTLHPPNRWT
jgi:DNA-binding response OmpR family regulator